jgi:hypothetical protein
LNGLDTTLEKNSLIHKPTKLIGFIPAQTRESGRG